MSTDCRAVDPGSIPVDSFIVCRPQLMVASGLTNPLAFASTSRIKASGTVGVGAEVMAVNRRWLTLPLGTLILEGADEFLLLRIDADDWQVPGGAAL